jgi:hypothetical protein
MAKGERREKKRTPDVNLAIINKFGDAHDRQICR